MKYHKINSIYKRDMTKKNKPFLFGKFADPYHQMLQNCQWEFTEKLDGTNVRVFWDGEKVSFGGRTDNAQLPTPLYEHLSQKFTKERMYGFFADRSVILFGEGVGPKIQKNGGNYGDKQHFVLFDVHFDSYAKRETVLEVSDDLNIPAAPVVMRGTIDDGINLIKDGMKSCFGDFEAEGVVGRPVRELYDANGHRIIIKLKTRDWRNAL